MSVNVFSINKVNKYLQNYSLDVIVNEDIPVFYYDFMDENGYVPAHRHPNGLGIVANTAIVHSECYVSSDSVVGPFCKITGNVNILDLSHIIDETILDGVGDKGIRIDKSLVLSSFIKGSYDIVDSNLYNNKFVNNGIRRISKHSFKMI